MTSVAQQNHDAKELRKLAEYYAGKVKLSNAEWQIHHAAKELLNRIADYLTIKV